MFCSIAGLMAGVMLDHYYVILRRKGTGTAAAGIVRRVYHNVRSTYRRRVPRH